MQTSNLRQCISSMMARANETEDFDEIERFMSEQDGLEMSPEIREKVYQSWRKYALEA